MPRPISSYSFRDIRPGVDCPWDGLPEFEFTQQELELAEEMSWHPDED